MKLQRHSELRVPLVHAAAPVPLAAIEALLSDSRRVLQQLLSGEQLEPKGEPGEFLYTPRPLGLPGLRLAPQVCFRAQWQPPALVITLLDYQLPGMEALQRKISYQFLAILLATDGGLVVQAQADLQLASGTDGLALPPALLAFLGNRALDLIVGRLERRCRRNLPGLTLSA